MARIFGTALSFLLILLVMSFLGCEGDQGPQGPKGDPGDDGPPGNDISGEPPSDMYFGLAITNESAFDQNGNLRIKLTFDEEQEPDSDLVVCHRLDISPTLDGDWRGDWENIGKSVIRVANVRGADNGLKHIDVYSGYNDDYIYFLVNWQEPGLFGIPDTRSWTPDAWKAWEDTTWEVKKIDTLETDPLITDTTWKMDEIKLVWRQGGSEEDMLYLFWDISGIENWNTDCAALLYHEDSTLHLDGIDDGLVDVWHWMAGRTGAIGYFDDEYLDAVGIHADQGTAAYMANIKDTLPHWMYMLDPGSNSLPPLWLWDADLFDMNAGKPDTSWVKYNTIPGYISVLPTGGRTDIECSVSAVSWDDGTKSWTLEFRRLRHTGQGDDVQF